MFLVISLFLITLFFFLTYFFSGIETGIVSLDRDFLAHKSSLSDDSPEKSLLKYARQPNRFLALTLIGINASNTIAASIATNLFDSISPIAVTIGSVFLSVFVFYACELLPKLAFAKSPLDMSLKYVKLLDFFDKLLYIPVTIVSGITRFLVKQFMLPGDNKDKSLTREELAILLAFGASSGVIREKHHRMAKGIIGLKDTHVCEIMIPRVNMSAINVDAPIDEAIEQVRESGYSRLPVFDNNIDQIVGVVYFKDLLFREGESMKQIMKLPMFVPESKNAYELFKDMRTNNNQTAVVLDEYGSTAGFLTLEDLLEEVFGEIHDEHDENTTLSRVKADGSIVVKAEMEIEHLTAETGIDFKCENHVSTLNGFIIYKLGRIPEKGECLIIDSRKFEILAADPNKVQVVKIVSQS
ncbi:MAG: HlyC/CorC family transporter [Candidatus Riflebacteria bacterium]|nr:HlyC/CorC family transporter [Candidatus Riflebacteria bacterium]